MELNNQWVKCLLGDIINLKNGYAFKSSEYQEHGIPIIRISDINDSVVETTNSKNIYQHEEFEKFTVNSGDILIAMSGATTGKFGIYKEITKAYQNQRVGNLKLISETNTNKLFVYYLLFSLKRRIEKDAYGGAQPNISGSKVEAIEIALPPLSEQHRIVAKIEELFSELDKGIENLKTARAQLKVYRQALLKHTFEGKLTAQWRAENQNKLETAEALLKRIQQERAERYQQQLADFGKSPSIPLLQRGKTILAANILPVENKEQEEVDDSPLCKRGARGDFKPKAPKPLPPLTAEELAELPELPEGWRWFKVVHICDVVRGGSPRPAGDPKFYGGNIPFLKVADITNTSTPYLSNFTYTITEAGLSKTRQIEPNTLLLSNSGATLGVPKICLISATMNDGVAAFLGLPHEALLYHYYFWQGRTEHLRNINQGAAQPNLNTDLIKETFIPICSPSEQFAVLQKLEAALSEADQLELTINTALQQAEALRQSILKKAFSGQLVPQDPHDEPASKLLERIKAERAKSPHPPFAKGGRSRSGGGIAAKPRKTAKDKA